MNHTFHYVSMAIYSMIHKKIFLDLKEKGLTIGQPKVLDYLKQNENATNKEIANACFIEPATLTSVLGRMEKMELVERKTPEENRRILSINLTEKGKMLADQVDTEFHMIEQTAFQNISKEEQIAFMNTYEKIYENLEKFVCGGK